MRKALSIFLLLLLFTINIYSQESWIDKEVGSNIFVKFPTLPVYKLQEKSAFYTSKTENCLFMVMIQFSVVPYFSEFVKLPLTQRVMIINHLLDNYIKGRNLMANKELATKEIKLGSFIGREITYSAVNPATGEVGQRFSKTFVVNDKI